MRILQLLDGDRMRGYEIRFNFPVKKDFFNFEIKRIGEIAL